MKYSYFKNSITFALIFLLTINLAYTQGVNMNRYITLTVQKGTEIMLGIAADTDNTPIKVVSGNLEYNINADTTYIGHNPYISGADTLTIYGNISIFDCFGNGEKITHINISHNTSLIELDCSINQIADLDVNQHTALQILYCSNNLLNNLDVSSCVNLEQLYCNNNNLSSLVLDQLSKLEILECAENAIETLDLSHNLALTELICTDNKLSYLDVTHNKALQSLYCFDNQISSLDVHENTDLTNLACFNNPYSVQALDLLYCSLPEKDSTTFAMIYLLGFPNDDLFDTVMATNTQNAINKLWFPTYFYSNGFDNIPATTGTYDCSVGIEENTVNKHIAIYPNPVTNRLHIDTPANIIEVQIYNISGALVARVKNHKNISVAHLPKGIYTLKALTEQGVYNQKIVKE